MMLSEEVLMGFAGVAIALVGFSGVVISLGRRGTGRWSASEMLHLRTLVEPSIITLFGAFVPSTIAMATGNEEVIWRASNGVLAIGHCIGIGAFLRRGSDATIRLSHKIVTTIAIAVLITMMLSSLGYLGLPQFTFALGMIVGVMASVHNFYLLLFPAPEELS
jgi:hypothetical protein